jgi:hypothetical protein
MLSIDNTISCNYLYLILISDFKYGRALTFDLVNLTDVKNMYFVFLLLIKIILVE